MPWLWLVCALLLLIFCISNTVAQTFGTIPVALIALAGWTAFIMTRLIVPAWRKGWFSLFVLVGLAWPALLGLFWSIFGISDYHIVRESSDQSSVERVTLDEHFRKWLEARKNIRSSGKSYPIAIVAAEGGGVRAAYWTAAILGDMQDKDPFFRCHVFAVSGVSGGSVGAVVWLSLLREGAGKLPACDSEPAQIAQRDDQPAKFAKAARETLRHDFLAPTVAGMLLPDLIQHYLPNSGSWPLPDRQSYLEDAWESGWQDGLESQGWKTDQGSDMGGLFSHDFLSLWNNNSAFDLPALLLNVTEVDHGRRAVVSNLRLRDGNNGGFTLQQTIDGPLEIGGCA
jgi:hypothetical protein